MKSLSLLADRTVYVLFLSLTGFIGKSMTRHFNRVWNYFFKGAVGSVLLVSCFPVMATVVSSLSLVLGVTAPVW